MYWHTRINLRNCGGYNNYYSSGFVDRDGDYICVECYERDFRGFKLSEINPGNLDTDHNLPFALKVGRRFRL